MRGHNEQLTRESLDAIIGFLPAFRRFDSSPGAWSPATKGDDGGIQVPFFSPSRSVVGFVEACYQYGWIKDFDWPTWAQTETARRLRDDRQQLARAQLDDLQKLLTTIIRSARFTESALEDAIPTVMVVRLLERAPNSQALMRRDDSRCRRRRSLLP